MAGKRANMNNRLAALRTSAGLTQIELSEKSGIHQVTIARLESGTRSLNNTAMATGYKLAKAIGCNMEDLIEKSAIKSATVLSKLHSCDQI